MDEHIQVVLLLGRRTKGNLACCFHSFLQVIRGFLQNVSHLDVKEWFIISWVNYMVNLIEHIGNEMRQLLLSLL